MNKFFKVWIGGWKVLWRLFLFQLGVFILFAPLYIFHVIFSMEIASSESAEALTQYKIITATVWVLLAPFIYYAASRLLGEFVGPRNYEDNKENSSRTFE